jgi:hypothetical protein
MQSFPSRPHSIAAYSGIKAARSLGENLIHLLHMTRALASVGRSVDLTGLDQQIGLLCAKALDLAPEEGRALRPMLVGLLADLDGLSTTLARREDASAPSTD